MAEQQYRLVEVEQQCLGANLGAGRWGTILTRLFLRERAVAESLRAPVAESLRAPGAHASARLAPWIKDTPELKLNLLLLVEAFLQLLASGLGTLALVWATVVLLGGFSTMLGRMDFWFITAIVFVEIARIVGYNSSPEARFIVDLPEALSQKDISQTGMASIKFVRIVTVGPTWIALAPVFLATACMSLSIIRLVGIGRHAYGGSSSNGNSMPALILFYALVLSQGTLFFLWFAVAVIRSRLAAELSFLYLSCDSREQLIERYVSSIAATCIEKGVATTINTNLVSFAAELLLQSQHPDDHTSAVLVLHSLVIENKERSDRAVEQICSSEKKLVYRLVRMLRSEDLDVHMKQGIAEIVAKLACKLHLADIPGGACCISSLLDPRFIGIGRWRSLQIKDLLFVRGLEILGELASDPENCREIHNTVDLVPKIIAPVRNGLHMVIKDDAPTIEIVRESLRVVAKLTRGIGECSTKLRRELTTKYGRTVGNVLWILSNSSDHDMRMLAVEILSRLTLDEPVMLQFTVELRRLLLDAQDSPLRIEAGKALIALQEDIADIQQLVTIVTADECSKEYRAVAAEMLAQICGRSREDQDRNRLRAAANSLSSVLKAIVTETTNITELDNRNRKFLASFLGLAVQIREKLVTAEAFADAVPGLAMGDNTFAETLKRIIEMTTNHGWSADEACLAIMKSATKLVTWMMEIDTISPYIDYLQRVNIVQELDFAVRTMVRLERYMVMTGGADDNEGYVTLQTLVEIVKNKLVPQQHQQQQQQQH